MVNDHDVVPVAVDTEPESTFHVTLDTATLSEAVPDTGIAAALVLVLLEGLVIDTVGA